MGSQISQFLITLNSVKYRYFVFIILFIALLSVFQWVNAQPSFCNSCHEMNFNYNTWGSSTHAKSATCLDCHSEPGIRGFIDEKVRGATELVEHIFGNFKVPIKPTIRVKDAQCLSCHPDVFNLLDKTVDTRHDIHMQIGIQCVDCHDRLVHNTPGEPKVIQLYQCESCHNRHGSFPMTGSHSTLTCSKCHIGGIYTNMNSTCQSCHIAPNEHVLGVTTNCDACHNLEGWTPALNDHSDFPLNGTHEVACDECHPGDKFLGISTKCASCHSTPIGHFKTMDSCNQCHNPGKWKPATFDHTFYPLSGEHQKVDCIECHPSGQYSGTPNECDACHEVPANHVAGDVGNCDACHTTEGWKPATFDHSSFTLSGAHSSLACDQCHTTDVFTGLSTSCDSCHEPPSNHQGLSMNCANCHNVEGWKPSLFNHIGTKLTGAHTTLQCLQCHTNDLYTGLSETCVSCHTPPNTHTGLSTNCTSCHTSIVFNPSLYRHPQVGEHTTGGEERLGCQSCHTSNYSVATCTGSRCHSNNNPRGD